MMKKSEVFQSPEKMTELKRENSEEPECMGGIEWCIYFYCLPFLTWYIRCRLCFTKRSKGGFSLQGTCSMPKETEGCQFL